MNETVQQHADFPSDETLAAYVDGRLDGSTRERVTAHIAECADCYGWWEAVAAGDAESADVVPLRRRSKWLLPIAAALPIAAGLGVIAWAPAFNFVADRVAIVQPLRDSIRPSWGMNKLAEAGSTLEARPIPERLSGEFSYLPPERTMRGGEDDGKDMSLPLLQSAVELEMAAKRRPTAENLHALGVAYLLLKDYKKANITLKRALFTSTGEKELQSAMLKSRNENLLNDLAISFLEFGKYGDSYSTTPGSKIREIEEPVTLDTEIPVEFAHAERAIDLATQIAPRSLNVAYNRAYILEEASRRDRAALPAAVDAWRHYLQLDADAESPWGKEAKSHLDRLIPS